MLQRSSNRTRLEEMIHQGCVELIFHQQQAGLFVGITAGPVVVGISHNALQETQRISFHREGCHHWVVVHCDEGVIVVS